MSAPNPFLRIKSLFHFTDRRNLPLIRQLGGLLPMTELARLGVQVPAPGGNQWSRDADNMCGMDRYVHLCFRAAHPMEYLARQDGRIVDSIFLEIQSSVLTLPGVMFTSDVSNKSGVTPCTIEDAGPIIDFEVLCTRTDWTNPAIQQRLKQAEKYEVLVPKLIPLNLIRNIPSG
jgi:hypothetical protein